MLTELLGYDSQTAGRLLGIAAGTVRALRSQDSSVLGAAVPPASVTMSQVSRSLELPR